MKRKLLILSIVFATCLTVCTACTNAHVHEYSSTYSYDKEYHWFECECGEDKSKAVHVIESGECDCGYKEHVHDHKILKYNSDYHYYECSCGNVNGIEQHKGGIATETELAKCSVCSQEYGDFAEHVHNFNVKNTAIKYLKTPAKCESEAVYYYSCSCGVKGTKTFEFGSALQHKYSNWVDNLDGTHSKTCLYDNNHIITRNCITASSYSSDNIIVEKSTCIKSGKEKIICECGKIVKETEISPKGHAWNNTWMVVAPTYDEVGSFSGYCSDCKKNSVIDLPALNEKDYNYTEIVKPSCFSEGEEKYVFVYNDKEVAKCTFIVNLEVHRYNNIKMRKSYYSYEELVEIFGAENIYGYANESGLILEVDSQFDCQHITDACFYCTDCGGIIIIQVTGDHKFGEWIEIPATCEEESYQYRVCEVDGCYAYEIDETYVPNPPTHTWGDWKYDPADCENDSCRYRECIYENCDGYDIDETYTPNPAHHTWSVWIVDVEPETNKQYKYRYCTVDGCYGYEKEYI